VIFIGEIRDRETMSAAMKASETGHLVLSTLHTNDAVQTINRIINMFNESDRDIVRRQLADTLRATIAQKLIYSEKNNRRYPACEIMVVTPTIRDYINKDDCDAIYELINDTNIDDMISMNLSLANLVAKEFISQEEALANSNDVNELEKRFRGVYQGTRAYYE
jgi:twitching motility protein PilT